MFPELFHIGSFVVTSFGAMMVVAFLAGYAQLSWGLSRRGAGDADDASAMVFAAGVGGILGGKVYYAVLYHDWHLLFDRAGLVWYGGLAGGALAVLWVLHRRGLPFAPVADASLTGVALGYAIGRIGCFLVGDDYGMPTQGPLGVIFPHALPPTTAGILRLEYGARVPPGLPDDALVPVYPTQLFETVLALGVWWVGVTLIRRGARPGLTALAVAALLACERFGIEFLRAKDDRFLGAFTLAQAISVGVLVLLALIWWRWRRGSGAAAGSPRGPGTDPARPALRRARPSPTPPALDRRLRLGRGRRDPGGPEDLRRPRRLRDDRRDRRDRTEHAGGDRGARAAGGAGGGPDRRRVRRPRASTG